MNEISKSLILNWIICLTATTGITVALKAILKFFSKKISNLVKGSIHHWDDFLVTQLNQIHFLFLFIWIFLGCSELLHLQLSNLKVLKLIAIAMSCWQLGKIGLAAIRIWHQTVIVKRVEQDASSAAALELSYSAVRGFFIITLALIALSNMGVDVGALLTGLGIGGIAVALAAQNILGDLLSSLSIALDKPFVIGDYIVVGKDEGTVEHIGIKTTRVRSISGEELIFSNKDLLESRLRNYKRMWRRRVSHKFSIPFETPIEKMKQIPNWTNEIAKEMEKLTLERCHLYSYENSFLNFEIVFWIESPDSQVFMDLQQDLLFKLTEKMRDEKVYLSVPIRSLEFDHSALQNSSSQLFKNLS